MSFLFAFFQELVSPLGYPEQYMDPALSSGIHGDCHQSQWLHISPFPYERKERKRWKVRGNLYGNFGKEEELQQFVVCEAKGKMCVSLKDAGYNQQDVLPLDCLLRMSLADGNYSIPDNCSPLVLFSLILFECFLISFVSFWGRGGVVKKMEPNSCQMHSKRTRGSCHSCSKGISCHLRQGWVVRGA